MPRKTRPAWDPLHRTLFLTGVVLVLSSLVANVVTAWTFGVEDAIVIQSTALPMSTGVLLAGRFLRERQLRRAGIRLSVRDLWRS